MVESPELDIIVEARYSFLLTIMLLLEQDHFLNVCFKASWIMNVLHSGFGFSRNYNNLHPIDKLSEIEVQWSLGAFIYHMQT
ncbi:hypothetical protein ACTXT7_016317 [Hymenolepis weldensis]